MLWVLNSIVTSAVSVLRERLDKRWLCNLENEGVLYSGIEGSELVAVTVNCQRIYFNKWLANVWSNWVRFTVMLWNWTLGYVKLKLDMDLVYGGSKSRWKTLHLGSIGCWLCRKTLRKKCQGWVEMCTISWLRISPTMERINHIDVRNNFIREILEEEELIQNKRLQV